MTLFKKIFFPILTIALFSLSSCGEDEFPYAQYNNNEVVENNYTGNVMVTSTGEDSEGDVTGNGDAGTYSFAWVNPSRKASLDFDLTSPTGSMQVILSDAEGTEVLNVTRNGGAGNDSYSGVSSTGKSGTWLVTIILTDFNGDGSYAVHPGD